MVIGITGSFGSGKTTVAGMFRGLGAHVVDADRISRSLVRPGKRAYKKIVNYFGKGILKKNREIDRRLLAKIVFEKKPGLDALNSFIHPEVIRTINKIISSKGKNEAIVLDAPLLVETGFYKKLDILIVVTSGLDKQVERLRRSKGFKKSEILQRIRTQAPLKKKLALADFIIDNSGSRKKTKSQVEKIWKTVRSGLCR